MAQQTIYFYVKYLVSEEFSRNLWPEGDGDGQADGHKQEQQAHQQVVV